MPKSKASTVFSLAPSTTTSHYSKITTTSQATSNITQSQTSTIAKLMPGYKDEQKRKQREQIRQAKKDLFKEKQRIFGKVERKQKLETAYTQMVHQTEEERAKQNKISQEAFKKNQIYNKTTYDRFQEEFHGNIENIGSQSRIKGQTNQRTELIPTNVNWATFKQPLSTQHRNDKVMNFNRTLNNGNTKNNEQKEQQNNYMISIQRKQINLDSHLFKDGTSTENNQKPVSNQQFYQVLKKAQYSSKADWRNTITNERVSNQINNKKIDTFGKRQKQLASSVFETRDYTMFQPATKRFIDMDNLYEQKRMNDPLYSDLFNQCMHTGGNKQSPIRKKGNEIQSAQQNWNNQELEQKLKKDYTNYQPRDQRRKEMMSTMDHRFNIVKIDL